jgi:hypothetical protein
VKQIKKSLNLRLRAKPIQLDSEVHHATRGRVCTA